ncbi:MAG: DUF167 domain-containing protein [Candidatus Falkowbacteria bacterium]
MIEQWQKILADKGELYLRVKVRPGANISEIKGTMADETVKIDIKAAPEGGRANRELINFLAKELGLAPDNVKIIVGAGERIKLVKIKK